MTVGSARRRSQASSRAHAPAASRLREREERRADHAARLLERRFAAGELERGERVRDERKAGERIAERDVERQHAAGAAGVHRLGERAAERALVPVELGHDDRDARVRVRLQPRPGPARRKRELRARIGGGDADSVCRLARRGRTRASATPRAASASRSAPCCGVKASNP